MISKPLGDKNIEDDADRLRTLLGMSSVPAGATSHSSLTGLGNDDHAQYVHVSAARPISAQHSFAPAAAQAPFVLGANAQGQTVIGLEADQLNKSITIGAGLTGGGPLTASVPLGIDLSFAPTWTGKHTFPSGANAIAIPDFTNATHGHLNAAGGGTLSAAAITSGLLALARGGTGADLSATGGVGQYVKQSGAGATLTVGAILPADLPGGFSGFANPSGTIGLAQVNGVATTAGRSDSMPALSQAIAPTWSGLHTFSLDVTLSKNLLLPTTSATVGIIKQGGSPVFHTLNSGVFLGGAGTLTMSGANNVAIGASTFISNTTGHHNVAIGTFALYFNQGGVYNFAIGSLALANNVSGNYNTAIGVDALFHNLSDYNVGVGYGTLRESTTGTGNTGIGFQAGGASDQAFYNTTGNNNTYIGYNSGPGSATQLSQAVGIGYYAKVSLSNAMALGGQGANAVVVGIATATPRRALDILDAANPQLRLTYTDNSVYADFLADSAGNLTLTPTGTLIKTRAAVGYQADNYASQTTGWRITGDGQADFRYLFADEMHVKAFIADLEQALAGGQIITPSVSRLISDFIVPAPSANATLVVEEFAGFSGHVFADADLVQVRQTSRAGTTSLTIADCWGTVVFVSRDGTANPPTQTYTLTRAAAPNAGAATNGSTVNARSMVLDYGTAVSSYGYHEISAVDGLAGANAPYSQTVTWTTSPATRSNRVVRTRLGNLKGITNPPGNLPEYGLYAGNAIDGGTLATSNRYIIISDKNVVLNNLDLSIYSGGVKVIAMDYATPYLGIGAVAPTSYLGANGYWVGNSSGTYKSHLGTVSAGALTKGYSWDGTNFNIIGNLTIAASGANLNYGVNVGEALLLSHFDGPRPYATDFSLNVNGHRGQVATVTGGVIGRPGKFGKAVQVAEATTNLIRNPSAETNVTDAASDAVATITRDGTYSYIGSWSFKWVWTSGPGNFYFNVASTLANSTQYTVSVYARRSDGAAISGVFLYCDSTGALITPTITSVGNGWYYISGTKTTGVAADSIVGITSLATGVNWYFDNWQCEQKAYPTSYADGSLGVGHTWQGTAHASKSDRTAATLQYPTANNILPAVGSISLWLYLTAPPTAAQTLRLFDARGDASNLFGLNIRGADNKLNFEYLTTTISSAPLTWTAATWYNILLTWTNGTQAVYINGASPAVASGTVATAPTLAANILIGQYTTVQFINGLIDDFCVLPVVLSAQEVKAIYDSNAPLIASTNTGELRLMSAAANGGYVLGNSNGLFGYSDASGLANTGSFALMAVGATLGTEFGSPTLSAGDLLLGSVAANRANALFSAGAISLRNNATTLFNVDTSGNVTMGQVAANQGNVFWNTSNKRLEFRGGAGGTTVQAYVDTTGAIIAGGGVVKLDTAGISMAQGVDGVNKIKFDGASAIFSSGAVLQMEAGIVGNGSNGIVTIIADLNSGLGFAQLNVDTVNGVSIYRGGSGATVANLRVGGSTLLGSTVGAPNAILDARGDGIVTGGLNVGTAINAATGEVRASQKLSAIIDGSGGGIFAGLASDVQLYRSAPSLWRTPHGLTVDLGLNVGTATGAYPGGISGSGALTMSGTTLSSFAGKIDIAIVNPDVDGLVLRSTTATNPASVNFRNTGGDFYVGIDNSVSSRLSSTGNAYDAAIWYTGNHNLAFGTNNALRMTLDNTGRLGVGIAPAYQLHVSNNQNAVTEIRLENTNNNAASNAHLTARSSTYQVQMGQYSATTTAYGAISANGSYIYSTSNADLTLMIDNAAGIIKFATGGSTERARIDANGNFIISTAALATTATDGFLYIPTCAGAPTGAPSGYTGRAATVLDTTNARIYFYMGGAWRYAGLT